MWDVDSRVFAVYRYLDFEHKAGVTEIDFTCEGLLLGIGWVF